MTNPREVAVQSEPIRLSRPAWLAAALCAAALACEQTPSHPLGATDLSTAALALTAANSSSQPHGHDPVPSRESQYRAVADQIGEELRQSGVPGGALAVIEHRRLRFVTGIGVKEAGGTEPVDADTRFRIGSISKTFTATVASQLDVERVLSLDAPITRYVPELKLHPPHDPSRITLRMLLSHTAGIPDYAEAECATDEGALGDWFAEHANLTLWTPPGRLFSYSNLGFSLAGHVIERAAGVPFRQLVHDVVLDPLELASMTFDTDEALASGNYAVAYSEASGSDFTFTSCALTEPPGYLWSSARDLARFAAVLLSLGDGVLDPRALLRNRTPHVSLQAPPNMYYGLGLVTVRRNGVQMVWHNGGLPGYRSAMWLVPERGAGVILFVNGDTYNPDPAAVRALVELLDLPDEPPQDWSTPPSDWARYVGTYEQPDDPTAFPPAFVGKISIELEGETLFLRDLEDDTRYPLQQLARDTWRVELDGEPLSFTFWRDRFGRAEWIASRYGAARRVREP